MKTSFCCTINQYICIFSSTYRNSELWFLFIFSFLSNEYYSFGINLDSCFSSSGIFSREFLCIFWIILNILKRVPRTSFTSSITGLYFFAKQAMLFFYKYLFFSLSTVSIHAETFLIDQHTVLKLYYFLFLLLLLTAVDTTAKSHLVRACLPILVVASP